jgi:hypothetical protein
MELDQKKREKQERSKVEGHEADEKPFTKLSCKYRKSCYETGELPEHLQGPKRDPEEHAVKVLGGKKVPTSIKELKLFCKYRKSCYVASAEARADGGQGDEKVVGMAGQNETKKGEAVEEVSRKAKANSDSHGTHPVPVVVHNGVEKEEEEEEKPVEEKVEAMEKRNGEEAKNGEEEDEEEESGEKEAEEILVTKTENLAKSSSRRRKAQIARREVKPKINEVKVEAEVKKEPRKAEEIGRQRKHKKYTVIDEMPREEPVHFEVEEEEEKKPNENEEEEEKPDEEAVKKQERRSKHKKYSLEEAPKEEPVGKVWAKKSAKVGEGRMSKLDCRYRKSCYRTGIVPEWARKGSERQQQLGVWALLTSLFGKRRERSEVEDILGWRRMSEKQRWFSCK